jgi:hypothetical protein
MRRAFFPALVAVAVGVACGSSNGSGSGFDGGTGSSSGAGDSGSDGNGGPTCTGGKTLCGTTCVDTTSDPSNCGKCGVSCDGGTCCASICVDQTASCSFSVTGVNPLQGDQNGGDWVTITGNGFVAGMRVFIGKGAAPAHVVDPHDALVLTPPLSVGTYDITITSGAKTSILPGSFMSIAGREIPPWTTKPMKYVRGEDPGLAVMQDGRVLIAGGTTVPDQPTDSLDSAEIYTRSNDSVTLAAGKMSVPRWRNAAVTLLDGNVLVVGGAGPSTSADLFDPTSGTFSPTAHPMTVAREGMRAALAWDGRVVIASVDDATADIYDPVADTFTNVPMLAKHVFGFALRMHDGRVMVGAGDGGQTACEIFDPMQNKFFMAPPLNQGRSMLTAHVLPDGRIMVIGGASMSAGAVDVPLSSIELYDPATNKWTVAPYKLSVGRCWHASALVSDGTILVMGGYATDKSCTPINTVDQVDPVQGIVQPFGTGLDAGGGTLPAANTEWNAVTLLDGSVLGVGGGACGTSSALPSLDFLEGKPTSQ